MAFQDIGHLWRWRDFKGLRLGVELFFGGGEQHVAAGLAQLVAIGLKRARVGVEIFMRGELQAVHKNAGHRDIAQRLGLLDQRQMASMQIAHGRDERGVFEMREMGA